MLPEILILLLAILLNGFFAAAELAILSARRARLKQLADDGSTGAATALTLAENSGKFLASVQIGITLIGVFAGAYGGATFAAPVAEYLRQFPALASHADEVAFGLVIALITYISLLLGELIPKRIAVLRAEAIATRTAPIMQIVAKLALPFVWLLQNSSNFLLRLLPFDMSAQNTVTEEEVKTMIAEGTESGVFAPAEQQMLEGVLRLGDRTVRALMTPRPDVIWIDASQPLGDQLLVLEKASAARLPVARGTLDELVGILYTKDVLAEALQGNINELVTLARKPLTVLDSTPVLRLVEIFKQSREHIAIVVDEHGSVEGVVTATDVLEAVTGALPEHADDEASITQRADGSYLIDAMHPIDEIMATLDLKGLKGDDDTFQTLAGFVLKQLGHLPKIGEAFDYANARFEVVDMDGRRIDKVLVTLPSGNKE